jgi:hypothetical protein
MNISLSMGSNAPIDNNGQHDKCYKEFCRLSVGL